MGDPLPRGFFARDADVVARDLLGRVLVHALPEGRLAARIVETEAYFGPAGRNPHLRERADMPARLRARLLREGDPASHSFAGVTERNRIMYGAPGHAYVYLIYGMHECMNVTTGPLDPPEPQAVLLRAGEPVEGVAEMTRRRGRPGLKPTEVASGPAKLAKALGITRAHYGADLTMGGPLRIEAGEPVPPGRVAVTPRVNVVGGEDLPLRYAVRGDPHVSRLPRPKTGRAGKGR